LKGLGMHVLLFQAVFVPKFAGYPMSAFAILVNAMTCIFNELESLHWSL